MSSHPLISIIVNNHNYGIFLTDAIDSALAQTHPHVEVVVVDDGSTDDSRDVIAGYGERITAVLKENGGQASAFNAGFAASHGEIIIFLDADDMLLPRTAEKVAQAWQPGTAKVQYGLDAIDENGALLGRFHTPSGLAAAEARSSLRGGFTIKCPPTSGNAFARTALLKLLPMPEAGWSINADTYLHVLIPFFGEISTLNEALALYRIHSRNNWWARRLSLEHLKAQVLVDLRLEKVFREFAQSRGFCVPDDWLLSNVTHVEAILLVQRLNRGTSPFPHQGLWCLIKSGIRTSRIDPDLSRRARVLYPAWLLAAGTAPRSLLPSLISLKLKWVTRKLRPLTRKVALPTASPTPSSLSR